MDKQLLLEYIRKGRTYRYINNFYSLDTVDNADQVWSNDDGFIFSYNDHGVKRLIYFIKEWKSLDNLLEAQTIDHGKYYIDFITNTSDRYELHNFSVVACMLRMSNFDCRSVFRNDSEVLHYTDETVGIPASKEDIREINKLLWSTFQTEISHLLTNEELMKRISQLTIHKNDIGRIDALLQAEIMPKKFYINQIINRSEKKIIHAILLKKLKEYTDGGGKYLYAWVDEKNIASVKFHKKYGMEYDGTKNMIYCMEI